MPDPADRFRVEPKPFRVELKPARGKPAPARRWARALVPRSKRGVAGAALAAMMIGIVVNAVALQHGKRLDLGLLPAASAPAPTQTAAAPPAASAAAPAPAPRPTAVAMAPAPKSVDAIADFLSAQGSDKRQLTISAQKALAKLGFAVKSTGALDAATRSALAEFQKSRHLPASTVITAKLVKSLTSAAKAE